LARRKQRICLVPNDEVMWEAVFGIGIGLEVLGLMVTAVGIRTTWHANAQGDPFARPVAEAVKRAGWWLNTRLPQRLRRTRSSSVHPASGSAEAKFGFVGVGIGWAPLPKDLPVDQALARLDERIRDVDSRYQKADHAIQARLEDQRRRDDELGDRIEQLAGQVQETARLLRVEGLRGQAAGIGLLAVGLVLQTVAQVAM
jgi:hypothetical protein